MLACGEKGHFIRDCSKRRAFLRSPKPIYNGQRNPTSQEDKTDFRKQGAIPKNRTRMSERPGNYRNNIDQPRFSRFQGNDKRDHQNFPDDSRFEDPEQAMKRPQRFNEFATEFIPNKNDHLNY